jgi:putative PIN family toxin of toxin-antitoxin system
MTYPPQNRVVVDTNVWLSAALSPNGTPAKVVKRVLAFGVPVFSAATFAELEARIWKKKFDRYLSMQSRQEILHDARALALWVDIPDNKVEHFYCRDKDDDKFIFTAQSGDAQWLVTGDQDLLVMSLDIPVRIITPADALSMTNFCP